VQSVTPHPDRQTTALTACAWVVFICAAILWPPAPAVCQSSLKIPGLGLEPEIPWELLSEQVEYDSRNDVYTADGGVTITKGKKVLKAKRVTFNRKTMDATAEGDVVLSTGDDLLSGDRIEINLVNETGVLYGGTIFTREKHFYLRGEKIEKIGKKEYKAYKASITACDQPVPDWKITGEQLDVTLEGYGTVRHGAFRIRDFPVLYTPFAILPVKLERQTGLLIPGLGSSDRKGFEWDQPFFWAINDQSDATLYGHFMSERGLKTGLEYRYVLSELSKGTVMMDYLDDDKVDDGNDSEDWGYPDDAYTRPNSDRYWFRMKSDQALPAGFLGRLDLDVVSDQDYLYTFKRSFSGFDRTKSYFLDEFGREIDDYTDIERGNSLKIGKTGANYSFNTDLIWYDDIINRRWESDDDTLQRLPRVTVNTSRQAISRMPVYWSIDGDYTYFYRQDGQRGNRADIHPRVYLPYQFGHYLSVEPSAGLRGTLYYADPSSSDSSDSDRWHHREIPDFGLDISSELQRIFTPSAGGGGFLARLGMRPEKLRHAVRPQLIYTLVPEQDQEDLPFFDILDRIKRQNRITAVLLNTLTSRSVKPVEPGAQNGVPVFDYRQFCRFELQQSYEFNEYEIDPYESQRSDDRTDPEAGEHLSPLYGRLDLSPERFLTLTGDVEWSHRGGSFSSHNLGMTLSDLRGDSLFSEYRYNDDESESLYAHLRLRMTERLGAYAEYEHNIRDDENIKTALGLLYNSQCWSLDGHYIIDREEHAFGVMVHLLGIGGCGSEG